MTTTYRGVVQNGVVVFSGGETPPEGTVVAVAPQAAETAPLESQSPSGNVWSKLLALAEEAEKSPCDLPTDLAANHDHYLYGTPKRSE